MTSIGFEPATGFPQAPYERTHARLAPLAESAVGETWRQFGLAWNAVAYRFQACAEFDDAFRELFARLGSNTGGLDRYNQQRDLYGCVVNACSVIESFYYATYAAGALADAAAFPIATPMAQRGINPSATDTAFQRTYPGDPVTTLLGSVIADTRWADLKLLRNVLIHRAAPGKAVHRAAGAGVAPSSDQLRLSDFHLTDEGFDSRLTQNCRDWVVGALGLLCQGLDDFTGKRFL